MTTMDSHYTSPPPAAGGGGSIGNTHQRSTSSSSSSSGGDDQEMISELRRGPWTVEEDFKLMNYIAAHGEGRWNSLARCAGLKRTGKSCRLRWLNYLRPDVRRGNITLEEQLMILDLHSRWGNRWSKIAQHLPGRTDNEIKNYWRTRVQKHAKQLKCDVNSKQFKDTMRYLWMPRLIERIQASTTTTTTTTATTAATLPSTSAVNSLLTATPNPDLGTYAASNYTTTTTGDSSTGDSFGAQVVSPVSDMTTEYYTTTNNNNSNVTDLNPAGDGGSYYDYYGGGNLQGYYTESLISPAGNYYNQGGGYNWDQISTTPHQSNDNNNNSNSHVQWMDGGGDTSAENLWNAEDIWFLQQQFNNNI